MSAIGIVGSRRRDETIDYLATVKAFKKVYTYGDRIVSGGCPQGGDRFAELIAKQLGITITIYYPDKAALDTRLPPRARYATINYARNRKIANEADILIAVVAPDRKGGTEDTLQHFCSRFTAYGVKFTLEEKLIEAGRLVLV